MSINYDICAQLGEEIIAKVVVGVQKDKKEQQITHVEAIDLAPIVQRIYGHLGKGGIITAKMDIEGDEFALLPHLERSQALCLISRIQMVWHPQYYEELEGRKAAAALGLEADVAGAKAAERAFYHAKVWKGLPGAGVVPRCVSLSELVCPSRVSVPPPGADMDAAVGPTLNFEACERERVAPRAQV